MPLSWETCNVIQTKLKLTFETQSFTFKSGDPWMQSNFNSPFNNSRHTRATAQVSLLKSPSWLFLSGVTQAILLVTTFPSPNSITYFNHKEVLIRQRPSLQKLGNQRQTELFLFQFKTCNMITPTHGGRKNGRCIFQTVR